MRSPRSLREERDVYSTCPSNYSRSLRSEMCKTIQIKYCPYITLLKELLGSMKCEVYKHFTPSGVKTGCAIFRARAVFHLAYERSASDLHLFRFLRGAAAELRQTSHSAAKRHHM